MAQAVLPQLMDLLPGMKGGRTGLLRGVRRLQAGVVLLIFGKLGFCFFLYTMDRGLDRLGGSTGKPMILLIYGGLFCPPSGCRAFRAGN